MAEQDSMAILSGMQSLLSCPGLSDFDIVEGIADMLEDDGLDSGSCHDFG